MKILVLSDLHLESNPLWNFPESFPEHDVAVFAGDIHGSVEKSIHLLDTAPALANTKAIFFTPGNHEFYDRDIMADLARMPSVRGRVYTTPTKIDGVKFIPATLWTDYALDGNRRGSMPWAEAFMSDHRVIRVGGRKFTPDDALCLHRLDRDTIMNNLKTAKGKTVVITHHCPHPGSIDPRFAGNNLNPAFASNLDTEIRTLEPTLWIHGHTHHSCDYFVYKTRIVCNPKGYGPFTAGYRSENAGFNPQLVVEI
jgi:Icc-related predicted phosphoesterase